MPSDYTQIESLANVVLFTAQKPSEDGLESSPINFMASEFVGAFLSSDQTERVSLYSQLLLALENNGFEDVEAVTKLTLEDCVHETELGNAAVSFLSKLISHERIQKSVKLRRAILNGSRKTLDAIGEMFGEGHVEYKLRNIFTAWTELFAGLLKEAEEVKVVINTLCPPLKDAISSKREVVAEGALGVWRSLIDAFFATFADKPSTRFSGTFNLDPTCPCPYTHLLVFMDFMLRPLKYMPDFCLEAKFETWVHLAGAVGQYSSQCYELVVLGLIRMSVGGSVEVVEPTRDVCSEAIAAVSDHSALLVEKCDLKIAEEWMKRKMRRHGVLAKSGISILATLLDVRLPEGSDCRARYTLSQVHVQLWSVWAALCRVIVDKVIDAPKRVFALRHVIAHFIGWINESHLSHDLIIHAFLMLCDGQYFPNGSSEYTISHAFVAVLRKLAAGANPSLLRQLCEAALKNVSACSDAVRLRLLKTITDGVLDAAPNRQCPQSAVVWIYVAAALTVHSNKTQDLNEGSATDVRYITTDKVLMFPLECCCAAQLRQSELAKQLFDFWKRLYISVQTTNAREANASGFSCAVRTANSLIKAVNDNEVNSDTLMVGSHLLRIIVETFPFTALGESIFEGGNDDPLETLCKMIVVFGGRLLDALSAKVRTIFDVKTVQELVKMSCKSVESNYCGPFCSELLSKIEPLFIYGFRSSNLSIRLALADFWRKTFAKSSKLQCSPILRDVLISLRGKLRLTIPMVLETRADFPCFDRDSSVLSMSQQTTKDFDKDLSDSEVTVPLVKPLTPVRESASIAPRTGCDRPANKRQSVDFRGDNERFEVIEPQSATKRMRLTEHQKEKLRARGATEVEERAPKSKEESPEVIEESPPREPSKTPRRLCRSVDIRSYLSPSGTAAQKSPPKASSAPQKSKKSFPRRLQFSGKKWVPEEGVSASPTSSKSISYTILAYTLGATLGL
ncbi:unnamed protein product [Toxocara canis]|uniref:Rif1_N domain-containing protein n=1 Tax=Toxocara canis TaxID=6265 RepID=A0A183V0A3_TOXCA|nr:unnamed protein product [Toxocara canis]